MELTWLNSIASEWKTRLGKGRMPHAVLLLGPTGTGKRGTAVWMAQQCLGLPEAGPLPEYPVKIPEHADLHWVCCPDDKRTIGIDQIRSLVNVLSLTSYAGGGKVAVIESAHLMTANAANSLLKTLEEPSGDALIVLVADRVGRLPATIFSRCQRINFNRPNDAESLQWLDRLQPGTAWSKVLQAAGGGPLAAIAALDCMSITDTMVREFVDIAEHRESPLRVAARWAKYEPGLVLDWLCTQIQHCIYRRSGDTGSGHYSGLPDSVLYRIDRRNLFCYLDTINRLRGQAAGSFNVQLTLESLLIDWAEGLSDMSDMGAAATLSFIRR